MEECDLRLSYRSKNDGRTTVDYDALQIAVVVSLILLLLSEILLQFGQTKKKRPTELGKTHGLDLSYSALCVPLGSAKIPFGFAVTALYLSFFTQNSDQPVL